jgi:hypothetical protein
MLYSSRHEEGVTFSQVTLLPLYGHFHLTIEEDAPLVAVVGVRRIAGPGRKFEEDSLSADTLKQIADYIL